MHIRKIAIFMLMILCTSSGCIQNTKNDDSNAILFLSVNNPLLSPSGEFLASIENIISNDINCYSLNIDEMKENGVKYTSDIILRKRDTNLIIWDDNEDILWCYNSDLGTYYLQNVNGIWCKYSYINNVKNNVPQALIDARPNIFSARPS